MDQTMNLEELTNLLEATYDYNYLLKNNYDQILAEYIVEKIGIHSVVRSDGVTFFKGGNEICWLRFKTKGDFDLGGETP